MLSRPVHYSYSVYGMNIGSSVRLPGLVERPAEQNVSIRRGKLTDEVLDGYLPHSPVINTPGCDIRMSERAMSFHWLTIGKFLVSEGRTVIVEPSPTAEESDLAPFLTGPIMVALLHQRGWLALHASAVSIEGNAVAFLGFKGNGKSTLAAHLQMRGHNVISDDIVPIRSEGGVSRTVLGYPRIKLLPDSVSALGIEPACLPPVGAYADKHALECSAIFEIDPVRLDKIYVLKQQDQTAISKLGKADSFVEITRYTHVNHHLPRLKSEKPHFEQCRNLVNSVPVFELGRPHNFGALGGVCRLLEDHVLGGDTLAE